MRWLTCALASLALVPRIAQSEEPPSFSLEWGSCGAAPGQMQYPVSLAISPDGLVYVPDHHNHRIQVFTDTGELQFEWGEEGSAAGQFYYPYGIDFDSEGNVYIAEQYNYRVQKFSPTGGFLLQWGQQGSGSGQLGFPQGLTIDDDDFVYVADTGNNRIQKYSPSGLFIDAWQSGISGPYDIDFGPDGLLYVANSGTHEVRVFTKDGQLERNWGQFGSGPGQLHSPFGISVGDGGQVYVADSGNTRIQKFTSDGSYLTEWGSHGSAPGEFDFPYGVASDGSRTVYAVDTNNCRIQKFQYPSPRTWYITADGTGDAPTIQAGIDSAAVGDTVQIACGTYYDCTHPGGPEGNLACIILKDGITLRGNANDPSCVVVDAQQLGRVLVCLGVGPTTSIQGLTLRGGLDTAGAGLHCGDGAQPTISNCVFTQNHEGGGIWTSNSSPTVLDCEFRENSGEGGSGVHAIGTAHFERCSFVENNATGHSGGAGANVGGGPITFQDCVFIRNTADGTTHSNGGAVRALGAQLTLDRCTFAGNSTTGDGAHIYYGGSDILIRQCILAFGEGSTALARSPTSTDTPTLECSDIFGNEEGDWVGPIADQLGIDGNIALDPHFCDATNDNLTLFSDSPCAPGLSGGCGLIGAFPVGCNAGFVDVTDATLGDLGAATSAAWVAVDGDGDPDLYVGRTQGATNRLIRNDGLSVFSDISSPPTSDTGNTQGVAIGDYDNDGDPDIYVSNLFDPNRLFRNDGPGSFSDQTVAPLDDAGHGTDANWIDIDLDGDLDLYLARYNAANRLFRNDSSSFVESTPPALADVGANAASAWGDYDGDGDLDVYLSIETGANKLIRNDGAGVFSDATPFPLGDTGTGQGAAWGDFDGDGDLDLHLCNFGQPNRLFRNEGDGNFTNRASGALADSGNGQSGTWADCDNDRDLDLVLTNFGQANFLFRNDGNETFEPIELPAQDGTEQSLGAAWADYDADGDPDLFVSNLGSEDRLYRAELAATNSWLQIDLEGTVSNRSAIGTRIAAIDLEGAGTVTRELGSNHGFWSTNAPTVHFGLGSESQVDLLWLRWPSGLVETYENVPANQRIKIVEGNGIVAAPEVSPAARLALSVFPNPFWSGTTFRFSQPLAGALSVTVYDVAGRRVWNTSQDTGVTQTLGWDGRSLDGRVAPTGIYFYRVKTGERMFSGKLLRLK